MQALTERFEMRLDQDTLRAVDVWRGQQGDVPSRGEAIRRLIEQGLAAGSHKAQLTPGETLIAWMLCDLLKRGKAKSDEIDPDFIRDALNEGHHWGLEWQYPGVFHKHVVDRAVVRETVDILDMWDFIELGVENLSKADRAKLKKDADLIGDEVAFPGFDANDQQECEYLGVARFLVEKLDRFSRFKGRDLNSHALKLAQYAKMFAVYEPIRPRLTGRSLSLVEITQILKAKWEV